MVLMHPYLHLFNSIWFESRLTTRTCNLKIMCADYALTVWTEMLNGGRLWSLFCRLKIQTHRTDDFLSFCPKSQIKSDISESLSYPGPLALGTPGGEPTTWTASNVKAAYCCNLSKIVWWWCFFFFFLMISNRTFLHRPCTLLYLGWWPMGSFGPSFFKTTLSNGLISYDYFVRLHVDRRTDSNVPKLEDNCVTAAGNKVHRTNDSPRTATQKQQHTR